MALSIEYFTLDTTSAADRAVSLSGTPNSPVNVALDVVNGTAQALTNDFAVDGTRIIWDSTDYNLYPLLYEVGDQVRVLYDKS